VAHMLFSDLVLGQWSVVLEVNDKKGW
jgi:hypothetical protein